MAIANAVNAQTAGYQSLTSGGIWNGRTFQAGAGISITNADGTAGNTTISATGSTPGLGTVFVFDDFLGYPTFSGGNNTGGVGNANLNYATSSSLNSIGGLTSTGSNPGVLTLTTESTSGRGLALFGNKSVAASDEGDFTFGNGQCSVEWYMKIPTLPDGTTRFVTKCGFGNNLPDFSTETAAPNDGCWFSYVENVNSGKWVINTKDNSGTTTTNTNSTADTNWHNYKVVVNAAATSVSFYIDGVEVSGSPIATNIPTDGVSFFVRIYQTLSTGNDGLIYLDFLRFIYTLTTPRSG